MPGLRDQADALLAILRGFVGIAPSPVAITLESILDAWLDDEGRAAGRLRDEGLLDLSELAEVGTSELADRLAGNPRSLNRSDIQTLRRLAAWLRERSGGDLQGLADLPTEELREGLRSIRGLGPTSVDQIVLKAFGRPVFPVGHGIYRVALRHGWIDLATEYEEAQSVLGGLAPDDSVAIATAARGLAMVASRYCKHTVPRCQQCPLKPLLGPEGPLDLGG